jgi:hypothetical protein
VLSTVVSLLLSNCSSDTKPPLAAACDEEDFKSKSCTCKEDDSTGETECVDGEVVCSSCEPASASDDNDTAGGDDTTPPAKVDAGGAKKPLDAGTVKPTPSSTDSGKSSAPVDTQVDAHDGGGAASVDTGDPLEPIIPEVSGECPVFKSGTATIGGTGGISISAGAKAEGTGSLIFYWHGTGSSAGEYNTMMPAAVRSEITGAGGVIIAFGASKNTGGDCSGTGTFGKDDFKIADLITACAVKNHGINPKRIYTTGCSAGGLMAGCMGIQRSNYIAAVAPNSGGITVGYGMLQDPKRVPNVMTMNGGSGDNVIVNFGQTSAAYDNWMLAKGAFAINCEHSSGHCGAPASLQTSAWQFLKDHPFGTKPSPYAGGLPAGFDKTCKIWTMTDEKPLGGM